MPNYPKFGDIIYCPACDCQAFAVEHVDEDRQTLAVEFGDKLDEEPYLKCTCGRCKHVFKQSPLFLFENKE